MSALGDLWSSIETKVKAATTTAFVSSALVGVLATYVFHGTVPAVVVWLVGSVVTAAATGLAGWMAKHTPVTPDVPVHASAEEGLKP